VFSVREDGRTARAHTDDRYLLSTFCFIFRSILTKKITDFAELVALVRPHGMVQTRPYRNFGKIYTDFGRSDFRK
jgi:hypothetical protein